MEATVGTMVDTAAEHTRGLVETASDIAGDLADVARGITVAGAATTQLTRRAKRHARKAEARDTKRGRSVLVRVIVLAALGVAITIVIRRRQAQSQIDEGPAPDAFGAAVRAEHEIMGNGAARAAATPGA
jgi:hypothetical protein